MRKSNKTMIKNKNAARTKKPRKNSTKKKIYRGGKRVIYSTDSFSDAINYIKQITIDASLDHEVCGSIDVGITHRILLHETPPISDTRPNCMYDDYKDPIIWHNHPKSSKFYPSLEDMLKVIKLKNKSLHMSFIFTDFGYWRLEAIKHIEVTKELSDNITAKLDWLYFNTERGRIYNEDAVNNMVHQLNMLLDGILHIEFNLYG